MALWTPAQIIGAVAAWHDASASGALSTTGSNVTACAPVSGSPSITLSTTSTTKPTTTTINGLAAVAFGGAAIMVGNPGSTILSSAAGGVSGVISVASATANYGRMFSAANISDDYTSVGGFAVERDTTQNFFAQLHNSYSSAAIPAYSSPFVFEVELAANTAQAWANGTTPYQSTTTETPAFAVTRIAWGAAVGNFNYLQGVVGETIVWNRVLTSGERAQVQGYLAWKWGLQAGLPSGHPYASAAPTVSGSSYAVAGASAGAQGGTGAVSAKRPVAGSAAGVGAQTGAIAARLPAAGTASGTAASAGAIAAVRPVAGAAAGVGGSAGALGRSAAVAGASSGAQAGSGAIALGRSVAGSAAGLQAGVGDVGRVSGASYDVSGAAAGVSGGSGQIRLTAALSGFLFGSQDAAGDIGLVAGSPWRPVVVGEAVWTADAADAPGWTPIDPDGAAWTGVEGAAGVWSPLTPSPATWGAA